MTGMIARCPETGTDVFPDLGALRESPPYLVLCPACGRPHRWTPLTGELVDVREDNQKSVQQNGADAQQ